MFEGERGTEREKKEKDREKDKKRQYVKRGEREMRRKKDKEWHECVGVRDRGKMCV